MKTFMEDILFSMSCQYLKMAKVMGQNVALFGEPRPRQIFANFGDHDSLSPITGDRSVANSANRDENLLQSRKFGKPR